MLIYFPFKVYNRSFIYLVSWVGYKNFPFILIIDLYISYLKEGCLTFDLMQFALEDSCKKFLFTIINDFYISYL